MAASATPTRTVSLPDAWRIEVFRRPAVDDPEGSHALGAARTLGLDTIEDLRLGRGYLLPPSFSAEQVQRAVDELLADPVVDEARVTAPSAEPERRTAAWVLVARKPGVMDPVTWTLRRALTRAGISAAGTEPLVGAFQAWEVTGSAATLDHLAELASKVLANEVIDAVGIGEEGLHYGQPDASTEHAVVEVPLRALDDEGLLRLSTDGMLSMDLAEMQAVQAHFQAAEREPTACELETLAQTWSEHCQHKTFRGRIEMDGEVIDNLLKSTIAKATHDLNKDWCVSVFHDNAGIVEFDTVDGETWDLAMKVETHNHPSAIDPYGGAGTGVGGVVRDILGVGLGAKPIANVDAFFVGPPDLPDAEVPRGSMHPARILRGVVAGVRDYGNRMGIPTVAGGVWFHEGYVANPLVYAGTVGLMPRWAAHKEVHPGDIIVTAGGRTGRDGIHGATFSSAELTDTHADEFSHAVQIGHAVVEKTVLDAVLAARDEPGGPIFSAITDCGAGGFSSAVGEMGEAVGAAVDLDRAPLKYEGLDPVEVWISEAQERMVLAVPPEHLERLAEICAAHEVEWSDLGVFGGTDGDLVLRWRGREVGRLAMEFLHGGVPMPVREATWSAAGADDPHFDAVESGTEALSIADVGPSTILQTLERLLGHPNIASKAWIVRQYDHEVQGRTVVKPITGVGEGGPTDAAVIEPIPGSGRGLAIGSGLATGWEEDPYLMGLAAIDECVRNLVCSGADPSRIAILDNFCWPGCDDSRRMAALVRASEACYDGAIAYRTPFISGKDSLNNQFTTDAGRTIRIPPTLLISGFAPVPDLARIATMDAKRAGNLLVLVGDTGGATGGAHLHRVANGPAVATLDRSLPETDLVAGPANAAAVHRAIAEGLVRSAHDPSEGGVLVAATEMAIAGGLGVSIDLDRVGTEIPALAAAFAEQPSRYLLEVEPERVESLGEVLGTVPHVVVGELLDAPEVRVRHGDATARRPLSDLERAWRTGALIHHDATGDDAEVNA
ncbi:MAG: phosphoribosylformylglycinamidine synthase subunit PurS [Planctomycetota bacterium]|nr:phosphoribosylformylglycinamidine synthase subunit PurS [Planctomycetota bacterium]